MSHEIKTFELANSLRKNIFRYAITLAVALTTSAVITATSFAACGSLTMAEMNWASAELMAQVDKIILKKDMDVRLNLFLEQQ